MAKCSASEEKGSLQILYPCLTLFSLRRGNGCLSANRPGRRDPRARSRTKKPPAFKRETIVLEITCRCEPPKAFAKQSPSLPVKLHERRNLFRRGDASTTEQKNTAPPLCARSSSPSQALDQEEYLRSICIKERRIITQCLITGTLKNIKNSWG